MNNQNSHWDGWGWTETLLRAGIEVTQESLAWASKMAWIFISKHRKPTNKSFVIYLRNHWDNR